MRACDVVPQRSSQKSQEEIFSLVGTLPSENLSQERMVFVGTAVKGGRRCQQFSYGHLVTESTVSAKTSLLKRKGLSPFVNKDPFDGFQIYSRWDWPSPIWTCKER